MKRLFAVGLFGSLSALAAGQNIVPNPSFESVISAPCSWLTAPSQLPAAVSAWTMPSDGSTDIFSNMVATSCYAHNFSTNASAIGQQAPRTGNVQSALLTYGAGCGSVPNYREYLQAQLTTPMVSGQAYDFEFWLSLADYSNTATNNFGVHFRTSSYFQATCFVISLTPQFNSTTIISNKTGWVRVNGTITATANWTHMVIGNFFSNAATSTSAVGGSLANTRYFIDDISVTPAVALPAGNISIHAVRQRNGTVSATWDAGAVYEGQEYILQRSADLSVWESITENDQVTSTYADMNAPPQEVYYRLRVKDVNGSMHESEAVRVQAFEGSMGTLSIANHPLVASETDVIRTTLPYGENGRLRVVDMEGKLIWESEMIGKGTPSFEIPFTQNLFKPGIYVVNYLSEHGNSFSTKLTVL